MRSTNIVVFLVLLNSAAALVGAVGIAGVGATPQIGGVEEIDSAQQQATDISTERSALDTFISGIIAAASSVQTGIPLTALVIFGSIGLAYYQVQRSLIIPVIMLVLVGGVTVSLAPSSAGNAIIGLTVLGLAAVGYIIYTRARER